MKRMVKGRLISTDGATKTEGYEGAKDPAEDADRRLDQSVGCRQTEAGFYSTREDISHSSQARSYSTRRDISSTNRFYGTREDISTEHGQAGFYSTREDISHSSQA
jgi:hypothetical protein